jgi:TRAP-type mannitol/chloroaromatic compound transport system permease small subunit
MSEKQKRKVKTRTAPTYIFGSIFFVCAFFAALIFSLGDSSETQSFEATSTAIQGTNYSINTLIAASATQSSINATGTAEYLNSIRQTATALQNLFDATPTPEP